MSITPLRCKLCNTLIPEPEIIIGENPEMRQARAVALIHQHFDQAVMKESSQVNAFQKPKHLAAMEQGIIPAMMTAQTWLKMGHFDLPDYLQEARDRARRSIAGATRKVTMTDEELAELYEQYKNGADKWPSSLSFLQDLRDRYEERGKYAPDAKREEVKA